MNQDHKPANMSGGGLELVKLSDIFVIGANF